MHNQLTVIFRVVVVDIVVIVVDVGCGEQQIQFLFECEHLAVDLRAVGLEALGEVVLVVLKNILLTWAL